MQARAFGLSLGEIKQLIDLRCGGVVPCMHLREMVKRHLDEAELRIKELIGFRAELLRRYEAMDGQATAGKLCGIVESARLPGAAEE